MKIQSEWEQPVITRHKGVEYQFNPGQIRTVPDDFDMNKVRHFKVVDGTPKVKKEKEEVDLDLNGDGKVDGKDASIAGKVLANQRRRGGK